MVALYSVLLAMFVILTALGFFAIWFGAQQFD